MDKGLGTLVVEEELKCSPWGKENSVAGAQ